MKISAAAIPNKIKRVKTIDPQGIERGSGLEITWSTGEEIAYRSDFLRRYCPCADCKQNKNNNLPPQAKKKKRFNVISSSETEAINLIKIWPIGNYALGIQWGDNHNAGIYTYELLKELANIVHLKKED